MPQRGAATGAAAGATTLPRLHGTAAEAPLADDAEAAMSPEQAHYLGSVLRRRPGDAVRLFNAASGEWRAEIVSLGKRGGVFRLVERLRPPAPEPGPALLFALLKRDATDLLVRMATELGVGALQPVLTARTNAGHVNLDRLRAIAVEAAEQSERLSVPAVAAPARLESLLGAWPQDQPLLAAIERLAPGAPPIPPAARAWEVGAWEAASLLVGPEGGFTPAELDALRACPFVTLISLGSRILRAETAAVAGLVALQAARERWGVGSQATAPGHSPGPVRV